MEGASQAILVCQRDGQIVMANPAAGEMFRTHHTALIGESLQSLIPEPLRSRHLGRRESWFDDPRARTMVVPLDLAGIRKDGSEFPVELSLAYLGVNSEMLGVAFVSDLTERKKNERALVEYKHQLQKVAGALLAAQEASYREIARDLQEVFSQKLAAIGLEISFLKQKIKGLPEIVGRLSELTAKIGRLSAELHRAARELHPVVLEELGLEAALQNECDWFQISSGISTRFVAAKVPSSIPKEVAFALYRVTQESLRNVYKHSEAPSVRVCLTGKLGGVLLRIEDKGGGYELDVALKKGGLALISMEERVWLVNGTFTVRSAPKHGTIIAAFVPLVNADAC
jgi:PAS domain S-box-containing protein